MNRFNLPLFFVVLFLAVAPSVRADRVVMQEGKGRNLSGKIVAVSAVGITLQGRGAPQEVPANIIALTVYNDEPPPLNVARNAVSESRLPETLEALSKINPDTLPEDPPFMRQEYDYFQAAAKARLAAGGSGDLSEAIEILGRFLERHQGSYHYYEICRLYAELLLQQERFEEAGQAFSSLAQAPWPEEAQEATLRLGMMEVARGKAGEARKHFETVRDQADDSGSSIRRKALSRIGLALCLVAEKNFDQAITQLETIVAEQASEDTEFQATLFNSLGWAYEQAGRPHEAILAYLHTDILFSSVRAEHIRALKRLSKLWNEINRQDRKDDVDKRLKNLYNVPVP